MTTLRARHSCSVALAAFTMLAVAPALHAQASPPKAAKSADSAKSGAMAHDMGGMDHMQHMMAGKKESMPSSGWKELDAFHALMMATWHPAKDAGDMAPFRAKAGELVAAAKALALSTAPKRCSDAKLKDAAAKLAPETQALADKVGAKASNNELKDGLKLLHDHFDVLEEGCAAIPAKGK